MIVEGGALDLAKRAAAFLQAKAPTAGASGEHHPSSTGACSTPSAITAGAGGATGEGDGDGTNSATAVSKKRKVGAGGGASAAKPAGADLAGYACA